MREYREVRRRGHGNDEESQYLGLARTLLGQLKNEMSFAGLKQGVRRKQIPTGPITRVCQDGSSETVNGYVTIEVMSVFGQDTINIIPFAHEFKPCKEKKETEKRKRYVWLMDMPSSSLLPNGFSDYAILRELALSSAASIELSGVFCLGWRDATESGAGVAAYDLLLTQIPDSSGTIADVYHHLATDLPVGVIYGDTYQYPLQDYCLDLAVPFGKSYYKWEDTSQTNPTYPIYVNTSITTNEVVHPFGWVDMIRDAIGITEDEELVVIYDIAQAAIVSNGAQFYFGQLLSAVQGVRTSLSQTYIWDTGAWHLYQHTTEHNTGLSTVSLYEEAVTLPSIILLYGNYYSRTYSVPQISKLIRAFATKANLVSIQEQRMPVVPQDTGSTVTDYTPYLPIAPKRFGFLDAQRPLIAPDETYDAETLVMPEDFYSWAVPIVARTLHTTNGLPAELPPWPEP